MHCLLASRHIPRVYMYVKFSTRIFQFNKSITPTNICGRAISQRRWNGCSVLRVWFRRFNDSRAVNTLWQQGHWPSTQFTVKNSRCWRPGWAAVGRLDAPLSGIHWCASRPHTHNPGQCLYVTSVLFASQFIRICISYYSGASLICRYW